MDLNTTLMWIVLVTSVIVLVRTPPGPSQSGRRRLARSLLLAGGAGYVLVPQYVGYGIGAVWLLMLVGSGVGTKFVSRSLAKRRFSRAVRWARIVARIYPFDGYADYPNLVRAIAAQHQGQLAVARPLLEEIASHAHALGWTARVLLTRMTGDWQGYVQWIEQHSHRTHLLREPMILEGYIQALGEVHRFEDMCRVFEQYLFDGGSRMPFAIMNVARLKLAAFAGETHTVEAVLSAVPEVAADVKDYWRGTALQASGNQEAALPVFLSLMGSGDERMVDLALRRMKQPVPAQDVSHMDRHVQEMFRDFPASLEQEAVFSPAAEDQPRRPWGTWLICLLLLAAFAMEVPGGTTDIDNLIRLGALIVPASAGDGRWTRVVTAAFLHFGSLHLILNMAGLVLFGRRLESLWGSWGLVFAYLTAAIGSVGLVPWFTFHMSPQDRMILVGASGGVMGLIGGMLGFQLWSLFIRWNALIAYDFRLLLLLVAIQSVFDIFTPNVSTTCHLLGLALGTTIGLLAGYWRQRRLPVHKLSKNRARPHGLKHKAEVP